MQMTIGSRWVLELRFSVAIRNGVEDACSAMRSCVNRGVSKHDRKLRWERDKVSGMMLSGWDETLS